MLIWQMWHKAVAINMWRGRISPHINQLCPMYEDGEKETVLHRFWSYEASQVLWSHATAILNHLMGPRTQQNWSTPDWSQSLFGSSVPCIFASTSRLWSLLKGITL
jgi:hypothetical protein